MFRPADSQSALSSARAAMAWFVLGAAVLGTLHLLYRAAFSAWMSGGPPNPYPHGWLLRAQAQAAWAIALAIGGLAAFRLIRELPTLRKSTIALAVASGVLGACPSANQFLLIDRCLDGGGRWNQDGLQCER